jgi:RHS repeat-associated protein
MNPSAKTGYSAPSDRHIYGSSRIGMDVTSYEFVSTTYTESSEFQHELGYKHYEISNHLGNVLSVITDQKLPEEAAGVIVSYSAVIITATDYSPFGVGLYGRSWSEGYRYGFNGKEKDAEGMGGGSSTYDYGFRIYSPAIAKFLSVDPLFKKYPFYSTYQFASNTPIAAVDVDGLESSKTFNNSEEVLNEVKDAERELMDVLANRERLSYLIEDTKAYVEGLIKIDAFFELMPAAKVAHVVLATISDDEVDEEILGALHDLRQLEGAFSLNTDALIDAAARYETGISALASVGIVYLRIDLKGHLLDYVGQVTKEERFEPRQKEHRRKYKKSEFKFKELGRAEAGDDLDNLEQSELDKRNGPTNKSNPNGGTSNKKNVKRKK